MTLLLFLIQVFVISLSGVLSPGPVTAAAIATGQRSRHAGALLAVGHGLLEFPLMILIMLGMGRLLKLACTQIGIGLAGGVVLLLMAIQMFAGAMKPTGINAQDKSAGDKPIFTGFILSAGNPYFLLWWATVGLALATTARGLGIWAFALFAIVHWLCDIVWLEVLSLTSFKGATVLGGRSQRIVLVVCSAAMFFFGLFFIYKASIALFRLF
jgi:threonine/homoserine/homoserine lactone efflux protein